MRADFLQEKKMIFSSFNSLEWHRDELPTIDCRKILTTHLTRKQRTYLWKRVIRNKMNRSDICEFLNCYPFTGNIKKVQNCQIYSSFSLNRVRTDILNISQF